MTHTASAVIAIVFSVLAGLSDAGIADTSVGGDDDADSYVGVGGVLLGHSWTGSAAQRERVARCAGCRWVIRRSCRSDHSLCHLEGLPPCRAETVRFDVSYAEASTAALRFRGTVCLGAGGPATVFKVRQHVWDINRVALPQLSPRSLTPIAVTGTRCTATTGTPTVFERNFSVLAVDIRLSAIAKVEWVWADGVRAMTSTPTVTRICPARGDALVHITQRWSARYTADGFGPYPVTGIISQDAALVVPVVSGRPLLVPTSEK